MIENYETQISLLSKIGNYYYEYYNSVARDLRDLVVFEKGKEIGSKNYLESGKNNSVPYIRVGDLIRDSSAVFVKESSSLKIINKEDILLALDGAPGRTSFGMYGAISSGIYSIKSSSAVKGLVFFAINGKENKKIIVDNSQGTTILHASKAIPFLKYKDLSIGEIGKLNEIFKSMISLKNKTFILQGQKIKLLKKYFVTN